MSKDRENPFGAPRAPSTEIETRFAVDATGNSPSTKRVILVMLDDLDPDPRNPRPADDPSMSEVALDELRVSMENGGQTTPIIVGPRTPAGRYPLLAGHRRLAAAKRSQTLERLEALLLESMPEDGERGVLRVQLLENSHRQNASVIADAEGVSRLVQLYDNDRKKVMGVLGIDETTLSMKLKVASTSADVKDFARRIQARDLVALYDLARLETEDPEAARGLMRERMNSGEGAGLRGSVKAARQAAKKERGDKEGDEVRAGKGTVVVGTRGRAPAVQRVALDTQKSPPVLYIDAKGEQFKFAFSPEHLATLRAAMLAVQEGGAEAGAGGGGSAEGRV